MIRADPLSGNKMKELLKEWKSERERKRQIEREEERK
jgi:hypothetical protein